jgi:putative transcriptional regulator
MEDNAGNLIRGLRQKLGMTQEEFAHEIAVTVSTVNRWENAHAEPSKLAWKAIQDLAQKRGISEDALRRAGAIAEG